jgi:hypothetical protein
MDQGQSDFDQLCRLIEGHPAFVKLCLARSDAGWALRRLDAVVGAALPSWASAEWRYAEFVFIADTVSGETVASWLQTTGPGSLTLGSWTASTPAVQPIVFFRREPSRGRYDNAPLPWPASDYDVHAAPENAPPQAGGQGFLVGDDCPSFPSFETAFRAFFTGTSSMVSSSTVPSGLARIRLLQQDAWFHRINVSATHLDVRVGGAAREGARVELNGSTLRTGKRVGRTGKVRLALPAGLPDDAWLFLSRDRDWLDYRALGSALAGRTDLAGAGVHIELTDDPETEIQALLSAGEGPRMEYKRELPGSAPESKRKMLKTVAAFANSDGGHIIFGMDPDEVTVVGLGDTAPEKARDRLGQLIRGNVVPPDPDYKIDAVHVDGRLIVVLEVLPGAGRPYGLQFQDRPVEFYVRRGSSTYPATQEEVRALSQSPQSEPAASFPYYGG